MGLEDGKPFSSYRDACSQCIECGWQNKKKGRKCLLNRRYEDLEFIDYYNKKHIVKNEDDLVELYELFHKQRNKQWASAMGVEVHSKEPFAEWMTRIQGLCPWGYITDNSKYWLETIGVCDADFGVQLPGNIMQIPKLFFEALSIVRNEKADVSAKESESGRQKNSN